jgi:hypothetical protein
MEFLYNLRGVSKMGREGEGERETVVVVAVGGFQRGTPLNWKKNLDDAGERQI